MAHNQELIDSLSRDFGGGFGLARLDRFGRIQIGGEVGVRDILKQPFPGAETIADLIPISAQQRSLTRIQRGVEALGEAKTPIQAGLRSAEIAAEGIGLIADFVPGLKAAVAVGAGALKLAGKGLFKERTLQFVADQGKKKSITPEGNITVFHGTSKKNAKAILKSGKFKGHPFFALDRETAKRFAPQAGGKSEIIELTVDPDIVIPTGGNLTARVEGLTRDIDGVFRIID